GPKRSTTKAGVAGKVNADVRAGIQVIRVQWIDSKRVDGNRWNATAGRGPNWRGATGYCSRVEICDLPNSLPRRRVIRQRDVSDVLIIRIDHRAPDEFVGDAAGRIRRNRGRNINQCR